MRKKETRTKIQLGGLVLKSGLADLLDITLGDDLQFDLEKREKAYALLGILKEAADYSKDQNMMYSVSKGKCLSNEAL